jgi:uncharacterized protein YdhG (YjbR/CyaY superfamily)
MNPNEQVDAYIAAFAEPLRTKLNEMRAIVRRAEPHASEVFSNAMPGYVLYDSLVWFAGTGDYVAFYPRGYRFKRVYATELRHYQTHKGAILFPAHAPLPATFITTIVQDRAHENRLVVQPPPGGIPANLGAPAMRALAIANIDSLATLARYTEAEILALHGIGPRALPLLRAALQQAGLAFRPNDPT